MKTPVNPKPKTQSSCANGCFSDQNFNFLITLLQQPTKKWLNGAFAMCLKALKKNQILLQAICRVD